jgi:hypothetical protein
MLRFHRYLHIHLNLFSVLTQQIYYENDNKYIKNKLDKTLGVKPIIHQSELRTYTKVVVPFVLLYCDKY